MNENAPGSTASDGHRQTAHDEPVTANTRGPGRPQLNGGALAASALALIPPYEIRAAIRVRKNLAWRRHLR
jgi:hypothetical protein